MSLDELTRRKFGAAILYGAALPTLILPPEAAAQQSGLNALAQSHPFLEASQGSPVAKQKYIDSLVGEKKPEEVAFIDFATPEVLADLKARYGYEPPRGAVFAVLPLDKTYNGKEIKLATSDEQIGRGIKSGVLIYDEFFVNLLQNPLIRMRYRTPESRQLFYNDTEAILKNKIYRSAFVQAGYMKKGIPGYPIEIFRESTGRINERLYVGLSELLSLSEEYNGLIQNPRFYKSAVIQASAYVLKKAGERSWLLLSNSATKQTSPALLERLRHDTNLEKLFPDPGKFVKS